MREDRKWKRPVRARKLVAAIGQVIEQDRNAAGLSRNALGKLAGVGSSSVHEHELGLRGLSIASLADYAIALGTTPSDILRRAERLLEAQS